jgi:steroid delta-isomerase-like uncharacterized protein
MDSSKLINDVKSWYDAFNRHQLDPADEVVAENCVLHDLPRGIDWRGRTQVVQFQAGWIEAFSNAEITNLICHESEGTVIAEYIGRGTHDGPLGPYLATGRTIAVPVCDVVTFNTKGQISEIKALYDLHALLVQLGLAAPLVMPSDATLEAVTSHRHEAPRV